METLSNSGYLALDVIMGTLYYLSKRKYNTVLCGSFQKERSGNFGSVIQNPSNRYLLGFGKWNKRTGPLQLM